MSNRRPIMDHITRLIALVAVLCFAVSTSFGAASAHEHREIADGQYTVEIGFINEPAFVNQQNGLYLRVEMNLPGEHDPASTPAAEGDEHGNGLGILGLTDTL